MLIVAVFDCPFDDVVVQINELVYVLARICVFGMPDFCYWYAECNCWEYVIIIFIIDGVVVQRDVLVNAVIIDFAVAAVAVAVDFAVFAVAAIIIVAAIIVAAIIVAGSI